MGGDCGCSAVSTDHPAQRRVLRIALGLNAAMFVVGMIAGLTARSSGLIADALDMLADASAYAIALIAIGGGPTFKSDAGLVSGSLVLLLGVGVLIHIARRTIEGSEPIGLIVMATATVSLGVNLSVLRVLSRFRQDEAHLRAVDPG